MSLNPHLGDPEEGSSWETVSNSSDDSGFGSSQSLFFGGGEHSFALFKENLSKILTSSGSLSRESSFKTNSSSASNLVKEVSNNFEKVEGGGNLDFVPSYDPSELAGKHVLLDQGLRKAGDKPPSLAAKVKSLVSGFFTQRKQAPSFEEGSSSGAFNKVKKSKIRKSVNTSSSKKSKNTGEQVSVRRKSSKSAKSSSPSIIGSIFQQLGSRLKKPNKQSPAAFFASQKEPFQGKDITSPVSQSPHQLQLEDQLKAIWTKVEGENQSTYNWVGAAILTKSLEQAGNILMDSKDKSSSLSLIFVKLQRQWERLPLDQEAVRAVACSILDMVVDPTRSFHEVLEENEASDPFINLAAKAEAQLNGPQMKAFISSLAQGLSFVTANVASVLVQQGGVNVSLGAAAVKDSLSASSSLLKLNKQSWSNSMQVLANDTFGQ